MKNKKFPTSHLTLPFRLRSIQPSLFLPILIITTLMISSSIATAQTPLRSAFTYQGQLQQNDNPATGSYDLEFTLYDGPDPGTDTLLATDTKIGVAVSDGLFTVLLDFGNAVFDGDARWLQVGARAAPTDPYTHVSPLQPLTSAPYALFAQNVSPTASVPPGVIAMWSGSLANIPTGWSLCDGTSGTPDLRDRFIVGVQSGEDPGATGGSSSHIHSIGSAGAHTHSGTTDISLNNLTINHGSDFEGVRQEHRHNFTTNEAGTHAHNASVQSHLPPYFKLAFIMRLP